MSEAEQNSGKQNPEIARVRIETTHNVGFARIAFSMFVADLIVARKHGGVEIEGSENLDIQGAALLASTHTSAFQTLALPYAVIRYTGRSVSMVTGHTKVHPRQPENPEILERTGEKSYWKKSLTAIAAAEVRGFMLRGIGTIEMHRDGSVATELIRIVDHLKNGELVGLFMNMSRTVPDMHQGVGLVTRFLPNTPVIPIFVDGDIKSREPILVAVGIARYLRDYGTNPRDRAAIAALNNDTFNNIQALERSVKDKRARLSLVS